MHRKTPTPNLGTSVFSLLTSSTKLKSKCLESSSSTPNIKVKKPFLRRLMSCLVMQSRIPEKKTPKNPTPKVPSANSSVDSYHINTSLGVSIRTIGIHNHKHPHPLLEVGSLQDRLFRYFILAPPAL